VRVVAFAPAFSAVEEENGGLSVRGFPMTRAFVDIFPVEITVPVIIALWADGGAEYDVTKYIAVKSGEGRRLATMQFSWHWDDNAEVPVKYRAFVQNLPLRIDSEGTLTIGLYDSAEATDSEHVFHLPVLLNPLNNPAQSLN